MSKVRVRRNGQITLPEYIRKRMHIHEGALLEVSEHPDGVLLKPMPEIKIGRIVGKKTYDKIISELDRLRGGS